MLKVCLSSIKVCLLFYYICVPCNLNLCFRFHNYFSTLSDLISLFTKAKFSTKEFHLRNVKIQFRTGNNLPGQSLKSHYARKKGVIIFSCIKNYKTTDRCRENLT